MAGLNLTAAEEAMVNARMMEMMQGPGGSDQKDDVGEEGEKTEAGASSGGGQLIVKKDDPTKPKRGAKKGVVKRGFLDRGVPTSVGFIMGPDGVYVDCHAEDLNYRELLEGGIIWFDQIDGDKTRNGVAKAINVSGPGISKYGKNRGIVRRWMHDKGMGMIQPEAGGEEIVAYKDNVNCSGILREGSLVYYDVKDEQATNISGPGVVLRGHGAFKGSFKGRRDFGKGGGFGGGGFPRGPSNFQGKGMPY